MAEQKLSPETVALRKMGHFQCRLDPELTKKMHHFMAARDLNANQALRTIISKFFS